MPKFLKFILRKLGRDILCPDSVAQENLSYKKNNDIMEKGLDDNFLSGLNKAQSGAVLACLGMLHHDAKSSVELVWGLLFVPSTNVAITEVAARLLKLVTEEQSNAINLEVPQSWPLSLEFFRFKGLSVTETKGDFFSDTSDSRSYVENSQVSESLLLMKFYSLSSGVVNHLLSDHEGRELDLPFEVTDQEMEIIIQHRSSFIVGWSGTGKTTALTMKLFQKEQWHHLAFQGCSVIENSTAEQSPAATEGKVIRLLFVTVSPKQCFAIKQHVTHLKSFACGGSHSAQRSLIDMIDFDEEESQFKDIQDSFHDIPPSYYPLVITIHKFLMMLDGTLSNSYASIPHAQLRNLRSVAFQAFLRTKEVNYEQFSSLYWPHFNTQLTKNLDAACVFTEIISHIKGGLGAIEACDGKFSQEDYVKLSEGRSSNLTKPKREQIYEIFQDF
ncbi:hypothetical protein ACLB2K_006734 [Fragaria x ananassa]